MDKTYYILVSTTYPSPPNWLQLKILKQTHKYLKVTDKMSEKLVLEEWPIGWSIFYCLSFFPVFPFLTGFNLSVVDITDCCFHSRQKTKSLGKAPLSCQKTRERGLWDPRDEREVFLFSPLTSVPSNRAMLLCCWQWHGLLKIPKERK